MSVVGFDLGNQNAYIAVARAGGIDVLINDYSLHATPTCVSFGRTSRAMGVAARNQISTNIKNTVLYFKHLIGRQYDDPVAQQHLLHVPAKATKGPRGEILFEIQYLNQTQLLSVEQIVAAFLYKLKLITEQQLGGARVADCVISVPHYFTDHQRNSIIAAGAIAGLNVLQCVNESVAVGIAYGIYKKGQLPAKIEEPPKLVAFIDVGHSATTASLLEFHERRCRVRAAVYDLEVGGWHFDRTIRAQFQREFAQKFGLNAEEQPRAWLRLLDECEKLKKQMSANTTQIPLAIECFMNDVDVSGRMSRAEFEEHAAPLFERFRQLLQRLMNESGGVEIKDIAEVEILGGSSRIPFLKQLVAHFFNREPKTTLNADDVVARGAAMQCAILSPSTRVMEFQVTNTQHYAICVNYVNSEGKPVNQTVFKTGDDFPFARTLPLHKTEPFTISAFYEQPAQVPQLRPEIGTWLIDGVTKPADADYRVIRVRLALDHNGIFEVRKAMYEELQPAPEGEEAEAEDGNQEDEKMETAKTADGQEAAAPPTAAAAPAEAENNDDEAEVGGKKKKKSGAAKSRKTVVELPIKKVEGYSVDLEKLMQFEKQMQEVDLQERLTADAKNSLEDYVYTTRDKLLEQYAEFVTQQESEEFTQLLSTTQDWLYDEGEEAKREEYEQKLSALRDRIEPPISKRQRERADQAEIERNLAAERAKLEAANLEAQEEQQPPQHQSPIVEEPMES